MGGKAFEADGLITPRMPTKIYKDILKRVETTISPLFASVAHAIEGPEKTTHGDLDVLVVPFANSLGRSVEDLAGTLGALKWTGWQGNGVAQFALPWPEDLADDSLSRSNDEEYLKRRCIQLDLNRFVSTRAMRWQLFNTSHGDLCNILSNIVRSKGLTINTEALYLRIASVEKYHRKAGRIELSRDPEQVLEYFGLEIDRFWQPFVTLDEMMSYAATCRFFQAQRQRVTNPGASLNWTDQKYLNSRPIFAYWIDSFLPAHRNDEPGKDAHLTRDEMLDDVFSFFGDETRVAYNRQKAKADEEIARQYLWPNVRSAILEIRPDLSEDDAVDTIKGLKRVAHCPLLDTHGQYFSIHEAFTNKDYDTVISWSAKNHEQILTAYRAGKLENIPTPQHGGRPIAHETETYTAQDDEVIWKMKCDGATWSEIMRTLGKQSKSQLQAHWKEHLQPKTHERIKDVLSQSRSE